MKKTLKTTLSLMLAAVIACTSFAPFAKASGDLGNGAAVIAVDYFITDLFEVGEQYVITGTESTASNSTSPFYAIDASVNAVSVDVNREELAINGELDASLVWTAVEKNDGSIALRNNETGWYLSIRYGMLSLTNNIYSASNFTYSRSGVYMNSGLYANGYMHFDTNNNSFYTSNQQMPWNITVFKAYETSVVLVNPNF